MYGGEYGASASYNGQASTGGVGGVNGDSWSDDSTRWGIPTSGQGAGGGGPYGGYPGVSPRADYGGGGHGGDQRRYGSSAGANGYIELIFY
jgi:hypothetical protein